MRYSDELPIDVEPYDSGLTADPREARVESLNLLYLAAHQVFLRVGWIFKTESIVMPVFMDFIGGGPVLRGWLMVLNRIGFSLPPVIFSRRLKIAPRKKWLLAACSFGMSLPFAVLSILWYSGVWRDAAGNPRWWMPLVFLVLYGLFFAVTGMNQLAAHALQGKVVRATHRGRLFSISVLVGAPLAILAAWTTMPFWLARPDGGFGAIFASAAVAFALAGVASLALVEESDDFRQAKSQVWAYFQQAWQAIARDTNCRSLAILAALFSVTFMMFPHFPSIVANGDKFDLRVMTSWVCAQNAGTAVFSLVAGPLADRYGNRAALHFSLTGTALAPLLAATLVWLNPYVSSTWSWVVFVPLGFTPVSMRLMANYALEIAPRSEHPKYVSALGLCLAAPVVIGAPLVGQIAYLIGYAPVFLVGCLVLLVAVAHSFRMAEPRHESTELLTAE